MNDRPLTIWCNSRFDGKAMEELLAGLGSHQFRPGGRARPGADGSAPPDEGLEEADIAFGHPSPEAVMRCRRLRWVQITSAGYTRYDTDEFRAAMHQRGGMFTNSSSVYDEPCAQHVLAMMLADARQLPMALANQFAGRGWSRQSERPAYLLNGQRVLLLGFGAIARRLVQLLGPLEMRVSAFRRRGGGDEPCPVYSNADDLDRELALADHIVNTLPDSPSTRGFVSAQRIARMKPQAVFYNVGRGKTVDQQALAAALNEQRLAAAYLDVTDPEPLPPDDPLWRARNCFITPHTAGWHVGDDLRLVRHFLANLRRFDRSEPLLNHVF